MKPNIIIISIDSLRFDRIYGKNKSAVIPNIEKILEKGIVFSQAISSADATGLGIGSMFHAKFSFRTGSTQYKIDSNSLEFIKTLKEKNYNIYATVPNIHFFKTLVKNFTDYDIYEYFKRESWVKLVGGIGESIIKRLEKNEKPWFYYIHLMDLHAPFYIPEEFDMDEFGKTRYDRMVSSIDFWIGKILEKINLNETLVIFTSDHGDHIPAIENWGKVIKTNSLVKKSKEKFPFLEPIGLRFIRAYREYKVKRKINFYKKKLTVRQTQALLGRAQDVLYDELIHIPLVFYGYGVIEPQVISDQVRQVDIFPTFFDLIKLPLPSNQIDGRSLIPLINKESMVELPAYIETGVRWVKTAKEIIEPRFEGKVIGIRTSNYKYWRSRKNPKNNIILYDLKEDPNEEKNISNENEYENIIEEMEKILDLMINNSIVINQNKFSKDEEDKIADELKRLGYIN